MKRFAVLCAIPVLIVVLHTGRAADAFDPQTSSLDELFFHAQRYGSTPERKARRQAARKALQARGPEALRYLVQHAHIENPWYFILAGQLVRTLDADEAVPALLDCLDHESTRVRKTALFYLGFFETPEHADRIAHFLDDDELTGVTIRTLGKWRSPRVLEAAVPDLRHEEERRRILAANALRDLGDASAAPALVAALDDPLFTVRRTAARALAALGPDAVPALLTDLNNRRVTALRAAIRTLAEIGDARAVPTLKRLAEHEDPFVRREAGAAVDVRGDHPDEEPGP